MDDVKVNVAAGLFILETRSGHKISLDGISMDLTREQYERLQAAYNANKFKYMNDDDSVADICKVFIDYYGYEDEDLEDDQKLIVSFPIEITNGLSFDELPKRTNDESNSEDNYSECHVGGTTWRGEYKADPMNSNRLELCDGIVASFNEEHNVFICYVPWLGRDIEIWLSAGDYDDVEELDNLKRTFEKFWNDKSSLLTESQNDIKEKVIPYIAKKRVTDKNSFLPDVSADDFDADYWLTSVYIVSGFEDDLGEVQMNFYKNGDEDSDENFMVNRDLTSGYLTFYVDYDLISEDI